VLNANERPSDPAARRLSWAAVQADDALAESLRSGEEPGHHRRPDAIAHHDCTDPAARRHPGGHPAARGNRTGRHRTEPLRTFRSAGAQEPMGSFPVTASA